jgi:F-type H+-transporting ATPase subunit delta
VSSLGSVQSRLSESPWQQILANPVVDPVRRDEAAVEVIGPGIVPEVSNLVRLLVESRQLPLLDEIAAEFGRLVDSASGRVRASLTTAVAVSDSDQRAIAKTLGSHLGCEVMLSFVVDPRILGGIILQVGDHLVDASLANRLQQLRHQLAG